MDMYQTDFLKNTDYKLKSIEKELDIAKENIGKSIEMVPSNVRNALAHSKWNDAVGENIKNTVVDKASSLARDWQCNYKGLIDRAVDSMKNSLQDLRSALFTLESILNYADSF